MPAERGSGLRVSATSLVLAGAERHSDRCGVSSASPYWPSATGPAKAHPNLASAAPLRQCVLLGFHLFQRGKTNCPEAGGICTSVLRILLTPPTGPKDLLPDSLSQRYNQGSAEGNQPLWTLRCQRRTAWRRRKVNHE